MSLDLSFPCDPRFRVTARDALVMAVRSVGLPESRVDAAGGAIDRFLADCMSEARPAVVTAQVTTTSVCLTASGRTLTVDL